MASRRRSLSRTRIALLIERGLVRADGVVVARASFRLKRAGEVTLDVAPSVDEAPVELDRARVLFLDDALVAIDKPALLPVRARLSLGGADVVAAVGALLVARGEGAGRMILTPHRLDRETSGVLVLARDRDAGRAIHRAFVSGRVAKSYVAIVRGAPPRVSGVVRAPIVAGDGGRPRVDPAGRAAETRWRIVRLALDRALVALRPRTGRTHQLRLHMASLGCPIVGDRVHGDGAGAERTLLHARRLVLPHPRTGARLVLRAKVPADFAGFENEMPARNRMR